MKWNSANCKKKKRLWAYYGQGACSRSLIMPRDVPTQMPSLMTDDLMAEINSSVVLVGYLKHRPPSSQLEMEENKDASLKFKREAGHFSKGY